MAQGLNLRHPSGKSLLAEFVAIASEAYGGDSIPIQVNTSLAEPQISSRIAANSITTNADFQRLAKLVDGESPVDISLFELGDMNQGKIRYRTNDHIVGAIELEINNPTSNVERLTQLFSISQKHFKFTRRADLLLSILPEPQRESLRAYEAALHDLNSSVATIGAISADAVAQREKILNTKLTSLESQFAERQKTLELEYQTKITTLEAREHEVKRREDDVLYMQPAARRRENIGKLMSEFKDRLKAIGVSQKTENKRWSVHILCVVILIVSASGLGLLLWGLLSTADANAHLYWFASAMLAMFAGTAIFYIRFLYSWFAELAHAEFVTRKLLADAARADYVVDLFVEMSANKDTKVPVMLLKSMLQDLFVEPSAKGSVRHPLEDVLKAVPSIARATVNKDGTDLQFTKR